MQNFLGADNSVIDAAFFNHTTNESFANLKINNILKDSFSVDEGCYGQTLDLDQFSSPASNKEWFVFPNPVRDVLQIHSAKEFTSVHYRVFNTGSKTVLQGAHNIINGRLTINTNQLVSGIYFIQIFSDNKNETHKILKL